jgi:hypothetical protein
LENGKGKLFWECAGMETSEVDPKNWTTG